MIPRILPVEHRPAWQAQLASAVRSVDKVLEMLHIEPPATMIPLLQHDFPLRVPHSFVGRMVPGDSRDASTLSLTVSELPGATIPELGEKDSHGASVWIVKDKSTPAAQELATSKKLKGL